MVSKNIGLQQSQWLHKHQALLCRATEEDYVYACVWVNEIRVESSHTQNVWKCWLFFPFERKQKKGKKRIPILLCVLFFRCFVLSFIRWLVRHVHHFYVEFCFKTLPYMVMKMFDRLLRAHSCFAPIHTNCVSALETPIAVRPCVSECMATTRVFMVR